MFVALLVVAGILIAAAVAPTFLVPEQRIGPAPSHPEWQADSLTSEKLEAQGIARANGTVGTVVFDQLHSNRFAPEDVESLTSAITRAGGDVQFTGTLGDLASDLEEADVFVVVDPATPYTAEEVETVQEFVEDGGKLVMFGEPNRKAIQSTGFSAVIAEQRSRLTALASSFGVVFSKQYVYDMRRNDGSFKSPIVGPVARTNNSLVDGVDQVAMYTPTTIAMEEGDVLLRTSPSAESGTRDAKRGFPVAGVTANGAVLAVGDSTFLSNDVSAVGDNDVFITRIIEFMAED